MRAAGAWVLANGSSLSSGITARSQQALVEAVKLGTVVMRGIRKAASILALGGVSSHGQPYSQAKAARARAELAEVETKVAEEQAAAIARALHEDEAHRQADLEEVAEKQAEAVPWGRPSGS